MQDGKRLGVKGVDAIDDDVVDPSTLFREEWPERDEAKRIIVFEILAGLLHWQAEPRHSTDPCLGIGEQLSPLASTFRTEATRTGRRVTSKESLEAMLVPFEESGPLVFSGDHTIGLRKLRLLVREEGDEHGRRIALRLFGTGKGGSEFACRLAESELVKTELVDRQWQPANSYSSSYPKNAPAFEMQTGIAHSGRASIIFSWLLTDQLPTRVERYVTARHQRCFTTRHKRRARC